MGWIKGDLLKGRVESKFEEYDNYLATGVVPRFAGEGQNQTYGRS